MQKLKLIILLLMFGILCLPMLMFAQVGGKYRPSISPRLDFYTDNAETISGIEIDDSNIATGHHLQYTGITSDTWITTAVSASTPPGGPNNSIQFNYNNVFSGSPELTYLNSTLIVSNTEPEIRITSSVDGNNCRLVRSDTDAKFVLYCTVNRTGATGNALVFDNSDSEYVDIGSAFAPTTNDFSFEAWIKLNTPGNREMLISNREVAANFDGFNLFVDTDDKLNFQLNDGTARGFDVGTIDVNDNSWHHILWVVNRGLEVSHLYVDGGVDVEDVDISAVTGSIASSHVMNLAFDRDGAESLEGYIDELGFYSRALVASDAVDMWAGGAGLYINPAENFPTSGTSQGLNLEMLLKLDESAGSTAFDSSGNGNNGSLVDMEGEDWVTGHISTPGGDVEVAVIQIEDGDNPNEAGKITVGQSGDKFPRVQLDGQTVRVLISGAVVAQWDSDGIPTFANGDATAEQLIIRAAAGASAPIFRVQDSSSVTGFLVEADFDLIVGNGAVDKDYSITFNGQGSNGKLTWMEFEDYLLFHDDSLIQVLEKLYARDTDIGFWSGADGYGDLFGDIGVRIGDSSAASPTNYSMFAADGTITQAGTARIDWSKITANNITKGNGTHSGTTGDTTGFVADIQTAFDGNFYHIDEAGADPGFELTIEFTSVTAFNWVNVLASYDGAATHSVQIGLYNFNTTTWDGYDAFSTSQAEVATAGEYTLQNHDFFVPSDTNYIGTVGDAGDVRVRIRHTGMGNAAHDLDLDVVALYQ